MLDLRLRSLFTIFLLAAFAGLALEARDMPIQAKLFPLTVAAVAIPLLLWQLIVEITPRRAAREMVDAGADFAADESEKRGAGLARALEFFVWLAAFTLALWGLGFRVAIPTFLVLYLLRQRETWWTAALFGLGGWAAAHFVFGRALSLPLTKGALWPLLGL